MPGDKKKGRCEETPSLKKDSRLGGVPVVLGGCTQEGCTAICLGTGSRKRAKLRFTVFWLLFLKIVYFFALLDKSCYFLLPIFAAQCLPRAQEGIGSGWMRFLTELDCPCCSRNKLLLLCLCNHQIITA